MKEQFTEEELETIEFMASERVLELTISLKNAILTDYIRYLEEKKLKYASILEKVRKM